MVREQHKDHSLIIKYVLIGAGLGFYNGFFYHPSGTTDFETAIELAILAAAITTILRSWKRRYSFVKIMKEFISILIPLLIFMLSLASREFALKTGGKLLVVVECTLAGSILGLLVAWQWEGSKVESS
jgi:hypothetical protein